MSREAVKLAGAIMGAAADVIGRIIELVSEGEVERAKEVADLFVATTKTQLANDRKEANDILEGRFRSDR